MKKNYTVIQDGIKECGSACLLSIIRYYGGNVSLERLLELTKTNKDGTNFYNLKEAANEIGLVAKGYKVDDVDKLYAIELIGGATRVPKSHYVFFFIPC